jgi:hypothetical protein
MTGRRSRLGGIVVLSALLALGSAPGCGVLNPSLVGTWDGNPVKTLPRPDATIVIVVMNLTAQAAVVQIEITKTNGGVLDLSVPLEKYGGATGLDHGMIVQECDDLDTIQLTGGSIQSETGGEPVEIPADLPPVTYGLNLFCGGVVTITIQGVGLPPLITVYAG